MSTLSQHLGLILNDPSDPFKRTDQVGNWQKLDQYPGTFICTSTTRPSWAAAQAGLSIYETDTRRTVKWTGSAWHEGQTASPTWTGSIAPAVSLATNQTVTYTIGTLTTLRAATLEVKLIVEGRQNRFPNQGTSALGFTVYPLIDGANASINTSAQGFYSQWTETSSSGSYNDYRQIPALGLKSVAAGSHSVGVKVVSSIGANGGALMLACYSASLVNTSDVS